jgi:hypothetical protein
VSELKNVAASVRHRLLNRAKETKRPFDELLQYYAMERFLYRLSRSAHKNKFVLKGALMFVVWEGPHSRATRDIDLAGRTKNSVENLVAIIKQVCQTEAEPDGMEFRAESVTGVRIKEDAEYAGVRVSFIGLLEKAHAPMQIDIGFGDAITPEPAIIEYPVILDMPAPKLKGYPRETVVAEKFHAMVFLGMANTRMKDFHDVWLLAHQFDFEGTLLGEALKGTFAFRKAELPLEPIVFTEAFWADAQKSAQWRAFLDKGKIVNLPRDLKAVVSVVKNLLSPVVEASFNSKPLKMTWKAPGPWRK